MIHENQTISEIVQKNYQAAEIFVRYNINYCCGGTISLKEACEESKLDVEQIKCEIEQAVRPIQIPASTPFHSWNLAFMIDYIINVYHSYTRHNLPRLETSLISFFDGHRKKYPETEEIIAIIQQVSSVIATEMKQEEEIIFPYIKQLEFIDQHNEPYGPLFVKTLSKPIHKLDKNNSSLQDLLARLKQNTNQFSPPETACTRMGVLYNQLHETHDNIMQHKHMENSLLFPAASRIEAGLLEK